jgi:hypothetical protein
MEIGEVQSLMLRGKYARTYVVQMVTEIQREHEFGGLPVDFVKEFAFLSLQQQMWCVTEEGIIRWMGQWDDLMARYKMHKAMLAFIDAVEASFWETVIQDTKENEEEEP